MLKFIKLPDSDIYINIDRIDGIGTECGKTVIYVGGSDKPFSTNMDVTDFMEQLSKLF